MFNFSYQIFIFLYNYYINTFVFFSNWVVYKVTIRFASFFFEIIVAAINYCLVKKNQIIYFGVIFEYFSIYLYKLFFSRRLIKSKNDYNYLVL